MHDEEEHTSLGLSCWTRSRKCRKMANATSRSTGIRFWSFARAIDSLRGSGCTDVVCILLTFQSSWEEPNCQGELHAAEPPLERRAKSWSRCIAFAQVKLGDHGQIHAIHESNGLQLAPHTTMLLTYADGLFPASSGTKRKTLSPTAQAPVLTEHPADAPEFLHCV